VREAARVIRVLVADDQALVRSGLVAILGAQDDLEVVGEAEDGAQAVARALELAPDVVVMDIRMPVLDGLEATRRLTAEGSPAHVLVLTTFDLDEYVFEALRAGAGGFLLKDAPPDRLAEAVRTVAAGEALLAPGLTRRLVERFAAPPSGGDGEFAALTDRELEIVRCVARGLSNAEIGAALHLSEATVKTHLTSVLRKLGLRDRTQVVVLAYERGIVRPGSG
jgi:DNA-binding NarL/FixJ family response regulator